MRTCLPLEQMPADDPRSEFDGEEPRCVRKCSDEISNQFCYYIIIGIHENVFFSIAVCMELVTLPNGMISYSPDMTAPYSVDTVATYTCNNGFRFLAGVGDQMRTCTEITESDSTVVSGAEFSGMAPSCEHIREFNCTHQHAYSVSQNSGSQLYTQLSFACYNTQVNILNNYIIISYSH